MNGRVKSAAKRTFATVGLEVRRSPKNWRDDFYKTSPTCQISNISFLYETFLGQRHEGFFVEVGAYDGYSYSNTWGLSQAGWGGVYVEPIPELAGRTRAAHQFNPLIKVVQKAAGSGAGDIELRLAGPYTSANTALVSEYSGVDYAAEWLTSTTIKAKQEPLDEILSIEKVEQEFDVLVVDVEGFEADVFEGFSLATWRPKMLIIELEDLHPGISSNRLSHAILAEQILGQDYRIVFKDSVNTIFVTHELSSRRLRGGEPIQP